MSVPFFRHISNIRSNSRYSLSRCIRIPIAVFTSYVMSFVSSDTFFILSLWFWCIFRDGENFENFIVNAGVCLCLNQQKYLLLHSRSHINMLTGTSTHNIPSFQYHSTHTHPVRMKFHRKIVMVKFECLLLKVHISNWILKSF